MTERNCDILVIGGGGSGLVAAVRAAELSGGHVIVLERAKKPGGGMLFASTMRTFGSQWQADRNIPDQSNAFIRQGMDLTFWKLDAQLVRRAVLGTGRFFDWYSQYELPEILAKYEPRPYIFDIPVHGQPGPQQDGFHNGSGRLIVAAMLRQCEVRGIEVLTEHRAVDAEVENGRITAIWAETPEGRVRFGCRVCILSCSTWIRNEAVMDKVMPAFRDLDIMPNAHQNPAYTGDGIPIAEKAGAFVDWDNFCLRIMGPMCATGETSAFYPLSLSDYCIQVDLSARRFAAEPLVPRMDPFDTGHVLTKLPKGRTFFLFSQNILERMIAESKDGANEPGPFPKPPLPEAPVIHGWFRDAMAKGTKGVFMADDLDALAEQMGVDPATLGETISRYNAACAEGQDWDYFKQPETMLPLAEGPYFALAGKLNTDGAFGGVLVNADMQAYRPDGSLVPGLYVTGDFAGGRHISQGGVKRQVLNDMSWALSSGFIAGESAAEAIKNE